ncbi:MAG: DUF1059 domain-containing protein [candidate division NC10 bacterium]|nr:DUF1059 domain-containing protein [candidate division NC10 bacterium]
MAKVLVCKDVGTECNHVIKGQTVEEVMQKAAQHAKEVHGMAQVPAEVVAKVQAAIKDE